MKQILEIDRGVTAGSRYIGKDGTGKYFPISTDRILSKGQSVLLVNEVVVGVVQTSIDAIIEV